MEATLELKLLGELQVLRDGQPLRLPQSKKTRALLAYLVLCGRPQRRGRLCDMLWDVADDPRGALRWCLSKIRPIVNQPGVQRIVTEGDSIAFAVEDARIDYFTAKTALGSGVDTLATAALIEVASSFRGELLEGLEMSDFDEFQSWCLAEREEARGMRVQVLRELCRRLADAPDDALPYARDLVRVEPIDESARAQLVTLLARAGRNNEAEQQHAASTRQLREFGVPPSGALVAALEELRRLRAASAPVATPPQVDKPSADVANEPRVSPTVSSHEPTRATEHEAFIGRSAELARLSSVREQVTTRKAARVAVLSGEPGVGKTALVQRFLRDAEANDALVMQARAYEAERGRPFGPWIDGLRAIPALATLDAAKGLGPLVPELGGQKDASREGMFSAVAQVLGELAARRLVIVSLDDLQWLDDSSAELLHFVTRRLLGSSVLFVATARSGELSDNETTYKVVRSLRKERLLDELEVGPLSEADTAALVASVDPARDADAVYKQCAGNPLFALELSRSEARSSDRGLPNSLTEVVRERIDVLPTEAADTLRWVAVLGFQAELGRLVSLTEIGEDALIEALELLERRSLVKALEERYVFSHDVVRHVVYNELSQPRRRLMHEKSAKSIDLETADESLAAELARHAHLAGDAEMAIQACVAAGKRALQVFAKTSALALSKRGFRYLKKLPPERSAPFAIDLWSIRLAAEVADDVEEVTSELERLGGQALDAGQERAARRAFRLLGYLRWERGQSVDAARYMLNAARLTKDQDDVTRTNALADAARCLVRLDRELGHAEALAIEARAIARKTEQPSSILAGAEGMLRFYEGNVDEAAERMAESVRLARKAQDRLGEFEALETSVMVHLSESLHDLACTAVKRMVELGEKMRKGSEGPTARAMHAVVHYVIGEEHAPLDDVLGELRTADAKQRLAFCLLVCAQRDLELGHSELASKRAEEALRLTTIVQHQTFSVWARILLLRIARAAGDQAQAQVQLDAIESVESTDLAAFVRRAAADVI